VAIVTGGDPGIGRSVAVHYAGEGAHVAIVYLAEHDDAKATKAAVEKEGSRCLLISGDVRDRHFCRAAVAQTLREFGRLVVLVNKAAFQTHTARFEDLTEEHSGHPVKTNLCGYFYMAQACVEHMESGATIVNTGSVTGLLGDPLSRRKLLRLMYFLPLHIARVSLPEKSYRLSGAILGGELLASRRA